MSDAEPRLKALMIAALDGDAAAYRALLKELTPHLRAYFARRTADAEDLVQETLIAIHAKRATYDRALPFTAWLHAIARYKLIDHFRRMKLRRTLPLEEAESVVAESEAESIAASRSGISESAVKVGVHRALKSLAAMIGRKEP